jgi:hypothetical protein
MRTDHRCLLNTQASMCRLCMVRFEDCDKADYWTKVETCLFSTLPVLVRLPQAKHQCRYLTLVGVSGVERLQELRLTMLLRSRFTFEFPWCLQRSALQFVDGHLCNLVVEAYR